MRWVMTHRTRFTQHWHRPSKLAKRDRVRVLTVIHGYGSSGAGGRLGVGLRKSFGRVRRDAL